MASPSVRVHAWSRQADLGAGELRREAEPRSVVSLSSCPSITLRPARDVFLHFGSCGTSAMTVWLNGKEAGAPARIRPLSHTPLTHPSAHPLCPLAFAADPGRPWTAPPFAGEGPSSPSLVPGYCEDSKAPAEFLVTHLLRRGANVLAAEVIRWSDGSYLEGQAR